MRVISPDRAFIDYCQDVASIHRGLTNRFGIRVLEGHCVAVVKTGDSEPCTFGEKYPFPVEFQTLPSHLHAMLDDYLWHYPDSDLTDVLGGRKSFQDALDSPPEIPAEAFRTPGEGFTRVRSAMR